MPNPVTAMTADAFDQRSETWSARRARVCDVALWLRFTGARARDPDDVLAELKRRWFGLTLDDLAEAAMIAWR